MVEHWTVNDGVYEPREDSQLIISVLEAEDLSGKTVLDMGTGSGILAYTVLQKGAGAVTAVDVNPAALENAEENLRAHEVDMDKVTFMKSDMFDAVDGRSDIIMFNPPYIPSREELGTMEERAWQGGEDGRETIDQFLNQFSDYISDDGIVILLQSSLNGLDETQERFEEQGWEAEVVDDEKVSWERLVVFRAQKK